MIDNIPPNLKDLKGWLSENQKTLPTLNVNNKENASSYVQLSVNPSGINVALTAMSSAQVKLANAYYKAESLSRLHFNEVSVKSLNRIGDNISNFIKLQGDAINSIYQSLKAMGATEGINYNLAFTSIDEYEYFLSFQDSQKQFNDAVDLVINWNLSNHSGSDYFPTEEAENALSNLVLSYVLINGYNLDAKGKIINSEGKQVSINEILDNISENFVPEDKRKMFNAAAFNLDLNGNSLLQYLGMDVEHRTIIDEVTSTGASVNNGVVSFFGGIVDGYDNLADWLATNVTGNVWYAARWVGSQFDSSIDPNYAYEEMAKVVANDMKADYQNLVYSTGWGNMQDQYAYDPFKKTGLGYQIASGLGNVAFNSIAAYMTSGVGSLAGGSGTASSMLPIISYMTGGGRVSEQEFTRRGTDGNYSQIYNRVQIMSGFSGLKEAGQYYLGAQILPGFNPTSNNLANSGIRILANAAANSMDVPLDALTSSMIFGDKFGTNFDAYGGKDAVVTTTLLGAVGDFIGELSNYGKPVDYKQVNKNEKVINEQDLRGYKWAGNPNWKEVDEIEKEWDMEDYINNSDYNKRNLIEGIVEELPKDLTEKEIAILLTYRLNKTVSFDEKYGHAWQQQDKAAFEAEAMPLYRNRINPQNYDGGRVLCSSYSDLYKDLAIESGIPPERIRVYNGNRTDKVVHRWVEVLTDDGDMVIIDSTEAIGTDRLDLYNSKVGNGLGGFIVTEPETYRQVTTEGLGTKTWRALKNEMTNVEKTREIVDRVSSLDTTAQKVNQFYGNVQNLDENESFHLLTKFAHELGLSPQEEYIFVADNGARIFGDNFDGVYKRYEEGPGGSLTYVTDIRLKDGRQATIRNKLDN